MGALDGKTLGKYRIIGEIGRGGMAVVYKAFDTQLERTVALKVLPEYFRHSPDLIQRFKQEAVHVATLDHPNIITIYDVGEEGGLLYFAMKYVEGQTIRQILDQRASIPPVEATGIIGDVASALDYAHAKGYIHRDVKPTNILVSKAGRATLTDFGIVKAQHVSSLTRTGTSVGTPEYMSPEQCQGRQLDGRSDIYSLGVVLYEMLTSRVPFVADTPLAVLFHHTYESPPFPCEINPELPRRVGRVVLKALAKRPEQRYATAGALVEALLQAVSEEETEEIVEVGIAVDEVVVGPLYSRALAAFDEGSWEVAIELFNQILAIAGDYRDTFSRLTEANKQKRLETLLAEAHQAMDGELWTEVVDLCVEILSLEPTHRDAESLLTRARRTQNVRNLYAQAERELTEGDLESAIHHLEEVLTLNETYGDAALLLERAREELAQQQEIADLCAQAMKLLKEGDWQGAIESCQSLLSLQPEHQEARELLAQAERGLALMQELDSLYQRALDCLEDESWIEAMEILTRVVEKEPKYRDAGKLLEWAQIGQRLAGLYADAITALGEMEREEAIGKLQELLAIAPDYGDASELLARAQQELLAEHEDRMRAERIADLYSLGKQQLEAQDWEGAIESFQDILAIDADHSEADTLLAQAHEALSRAQEVSWLFEQIATSSREQDWRQVVEGATRLLELKPEHREAADLLMQAQEALSRAEMVGALYEQAVISSREGNWDEAIASLMSLLELEPEHEEATVLLAQAQEASSQAEQAASLYERAVRSSRDQDWSAAVTSLTHLLELEPEHKDAVDLLARARHQLTQEQAERSRLEHVARLYEQAEELLCEEKWPEGLELLHEVASLEPQYREAVSLIAQAEQAVETERRLKDLYREGTQALMAEHWQEAIETFQQVVSIRSDYQDATKKLQEAQKGEKLAKIYAEARALLEDQEWEEAAQLLENLLTERPGYKDAPQLMETAHTALAPLPAVAVSTEQVAIGPLVQAASEVISSRKPFMLGIVGAVVAGAVIIVGGYFLFSRGTPEETTTGESSMPPASSSSVAIMIDTAQPAMVAPSPEYAAEEIMSLTGEAIADVNSFHFELQTSGTTVYLEDGEPAIFISAEGDVLRPDSLDMQARVTVSGFPVVIRIIIVGQERLMSTPLTEEWVDLPSSLDLWSILGERSIVDQLWEVRDMTLIGLDEIGGEPVYHLIGSAEGMSSYLQAIGIVTDEEVEIWTHKADFGLRRVQVTGLDDEGEEVSWVMKLSALDEPVDIRPPTPTPTPTMTHTPTASPTATATPTATISSDPSVYDNFNNPAYDGTYNTGLWLPEIEDEIAEYVDVEQQNGLLVFTNSPHPVDGGGCMRLRRSSLWTLGQVRFLEARMMIDSDHEGNYAFVKIQISADLRAHGWWTQCRLGSYAGGEDEHAGFICDVYTHDDEQFSSEYLTPLVHVSYDEWYTARIGVDPQTARLDFYLDGELIGSHVPEDAAELLTVRVWPKVGIWQVANSSATRYIDDVRVAQ
jgi:outer membrane protein assembly factor BamD (BamD/ComL family)